MEEDRKTFLEAVRENSQSLMTGLQAVQTPARVLGREPKYRKLEDSDDVEHYLVAFERFASTYDLPKEVWAQKVAPLLTGKAQAAYACMDMERIGDYDELKKAILRRYDINEETYRQRFRGYRKLPEESYAELGIKLKDLFTKWIQPGGKTKEEVCEAIVLEQLLDDMTPELRVWVKERKPNTLREASEMADNYVAARKGNRDRRVCTNCNKPGRIARFCRNADVKSDQKPDTLGGESESKATSLEKVTSEKVKVKNITCFACGGAGHYASKCPQRSGSDKKAKIGTTSLLAHSGKRTEKLVPMSGQLGDTNFCVVKGELDGESVSMLVDTGSTHTLVQRDLVREDKVDHQSQVQVKCCHGDMRLYPTADVSLTIDGRTHNVKAGVLSKLPQPVLLGRDVPALPQLVQKEASSCLVLTRAGKKATQEEEDRLARASCASGASPSPLGSADSEFRELAANLDEGLFQSGGKARRNRKQRQLAKRMFTLFGNGKYGEETQGYESNPSMGSQAVSLGESQSPVEVAAVEQVAPGEEGETLGEVQDYPRVVNASELQSEDPTLSGIRERAKDGKGDCFWRDGLLYREWRPAGSEGTRDMVVSQLVLPLKCRSGVLRLAHDIPASGHLGRKKTLDRIQRRFFWPVISRQVAEYCRCCPACQKSAGRKARERARLVPMPVVDEPFRRIAMDMVGPLDRSRSGNRYILVVCDYATRYPEAVPLKSTEAVVVAEQLWQIFSRVGIPQEILTDQGANVTSVVEGGLQDDWSTSYSHQSVPSTN